MKTSFLSPNRHTQVPYHPWLVEIDRELNKRITFKRTLASRETYFDFKARDEISGFNGEV